MGRFLCALALLIGLVWTGPQPLAAEEEGVENPAVSLTDLSVPSHETTPRRTYTDKVLAIAGLLVLWGLTRKENKRKEARVPKRVHPMTPQELGAALMPIVEVLDLNGFRALHLSGPEAAQHLGEDAENYLTSRSRETFLANLNRIHQDLPKTASYLDLKIDGDLNCALRVKAGEEIQHVPVGTAVYIGAILRLV